MGSNLSSIWRAKAYVLKALPLATVGAGLGALTFGLGANGMANIIANTLNIDSNYFTSTIGIKVGTYVASTVGAFIAATKLDYYGENKVGAWCSANSGDSKFIHQENGKIIACLATSTVMPATIQYSNTIGKIAQYAFN